MIASSRQTEIEISYGRPLAQIINDFRAQRRSWDAIAAELGVNRSTLRAWRLHCGLPVSRADCLHPARERPRADFVRRQQQIEVEFAEPLREIIIGMREQGCSWATVAGALGIYHTTLLRWRKRIGLPVDQHASVRDIDPRNGIQTKARQLGYTDAWDAIRTLRLMGLTISQVADRLGIHAVTVTAYSVPEVRGRQNFGPRHASAAARNLPRPPRKPAPDHPWRITLTARNAP